MEDNNINSEEKKTPTFEELISSPMTEAEARVQLANLDIQLAQCQQDRAAVDQRVADISVVRAVVLRRVLNPVKEATADVSND